MHIAQHPGNERFRALVNTCFDEAYCETYTMTEKRAVAESIIAHIQCLDPPGRFLKRSGRSTHSRGMEGPWEELSQREAIKKTCQALRDCNRQDRSGYASAVPVPDDVRRIAELKSQTGMTNKQRAEAAALASKEAFEKSVEKRGRPYELAQISAQAEGQPSGRSSAVSPSVEHAAEWLKKQRRMDDSTSSQQRQQVLTLTAPSTATASATPPVPIATPATAATTGTIPSAATLPPHSSSPLPLSHLQPPPSPASQHLMQHHLSALPDSPPMAAQQAALFHHYPHHSHQQQEPPDTPLVYSSGAPAAGGPLEYDTKPEPTMSQVSGGSLFDHHQEQQQHDHHHHHHHQQPLQHHQSAVDIDHLQLAAEAAAALMGEDVGDVAVDPEDPALSSSPSSARFPHASSASVANSELGGDDDDQHTPLDYTPPSPTPLPPHHHTHHPHHPHHHQQQHHHHDPSSSSPFDRQV